jgi:polyvinyl alcohol dehydrogenase (cytochrome)
MRADRLLGRTTLCASLVCALLLGCESTQSGTSEGGFDAAVTHSAADAAQEPEAESEAGGEPDSAPPDEPPAAPVWSAYGRDHRNSQNNPDEQRVTAASVSGLRELWRVQIPSGASSTPAVYDGRVYFGGWDGSIYAVDALSGKIHWQRRVTDGIVRSTPLVTEERVYVATTASLVALERRTGATVFETLLDGHPLTLIDSSPKLVDGLIILGIASFEIRDDNPDPTFIGSVVGVDAVTGELVWRVETSGEPGSPPCAGGAGAGVWSSAAIDEELGLAYIGTGQGYEDPASTCSDSLLAIRYARDHRGERIAWLVQFRQGDVFSVTRPDLTADADVGAAPNLFEIHGRPVVGVGDKGGSYRVFDRGTGELVWRKDLEIGLIVGAGGVMTSAAVHEDTVYVTSNRNFVGLYVATGEHHPWDQSTLYALDTTSGEERWRVELPSGVYGSLAIAGGVLYHPIIDSRFYARDLATGEELWSVELERDIGAGPSVAGGRVYLSTGMALNGAIDTGGAVHCFGLGDAPTIVWDAPSEELEPLAPDQCLAAVQLAQSSECSECMCRCDATAAGHCGSCWLLAPCFNASCWFAAAGDDMRACAELFCAGKLLPSFSFDRGVDVAPCVVECAASCGGWPE